MFEQMAKDFDTMSKFMYAIEERVAKKLLRSTVADFPRPPFDTGALRRSGQAYVGNHLVSTTKRMSEAQGSNPKTASRKYKGPSETPSGPTQIGTDVPSVHGASGKGITIVYTKNYAAKMHSWPGNFTAPDAGSGFISTKFEYVPGFLREELHRMFKWSAKS